MEQIFKISEGANPNYLASICIVGEIYPIEGADKICRTTVNGYEIVVGNDVKQGDTVVYVPVETALCDEYLAANNLYEIGEWERNANHTDVGILMGKMAELKSEGKYDEAELVYKEAKSKVGYFNKRNRVRIITLKGCVSNGFIASTDSLIKFNPSLADINFAELVDTRFNYVGDKEFCWKYIPPIKERNYNTPQKHYKNRQKHIKKFDKLIENQWHFHYDTEKLEGDNIGKYLHPNDVVTITTKVHGTSFIMSRILVNKKLSTWEKIKKFFGIKVQLSEYSNIYSSRSVIKNRYINEGKQNSFYDVDIWGCVNRDFSPYLSDGMTVYGEIAGYLEGTSTMIQKDHDYGCDVGQWKFMPYRITETDVFGNVKEWEISEVDAWTRNLVKEHPELGNKVLFLEILYHGKLVDLYPYLDVNDEKWALNLLNEIKNDRKNFYMEEKEHLCHLYEKEALAAKDVLEKAKKENQSKKIISKLEKDYNKWESKRAPHEGIVIRKDNDPISEAFKIKTIAHFFREAVQHDNDEVDIEETA